MSAPSSTPPSLSIEVVRKAVKALLKWKISQSNKMDKAQLLEHDEFVYLVLTLKKIPPKERVNAHKIALPHRLHSPADSSELCLFIDDRSKSELTSAAAKEKIKSEDIPITKVIKLSKLRSDYKPFEAKRKLCNSYDMFFADKRVIPLLPKLLGKTFFKKSKIPLPVELTHNNWKEQIERACSSALLFMRNGACSVVKVGKVSMASEEIVENVVAAIAGVVETLPKKWGGVRSFHLKLSHSLSLPIYQTVPDMKLRIDGINSNGDEKNVEEVSSDLDAEEDLSGKEEKSSSKKVPKKGSIKKVRYMDTIVDDDDDDLVTEIANGKGEKDDDIEMGSAEIGDKKRKKGDLDGHKKVKKSRKVAEEDGVGQKKEKKTRVEKTEKKMKLKDGAVKPRDKKVKQKQLA